MKSKVKIYKSKIGIGLAILLILAFAIPSFLMIFNGTHWLFIAVLVPVMLFILNIFSNTYYTIDGEVLRIRSGFLYDVKIDINSIRKLSETRDLISSPALSLDRLELMYNKYDSVLISPKDKPGFIKELKALNPRIELKLKETVI